MHTALKHASLLATVAVPGALAAALSGLALPAGFDAFSVFCGFAATLVVATFASDYGRRSRTLDSAVTAAAAPKAAHPLAA